ncbi:Abi family protein [Guyparkeria sp.]|uniref:Abi family protein n=1 Tax=Guyparkeria sp. TaxID=2035736 RepID=UPI0039705CB5
MEFSKPAKSLEEQLALLESRGLIVDDTERALHYLRHLNYYRLTAYWLPFKAHQSPHRFRDGTRFEDVLNLYVFDRAFRLLLLDAIERVEVSIRTAWAYHMAHRYGPHAYLDASHARSTEMHARHLAKLEKEIARSDEVFIQHYNAKYARPETPPIWAVCEIMSLGSLSRWVTHMHPSDRDALARPYGLPQQVLRSFVRHLSYVRNVCAHHSRLWNRRLTVTMELPRRRPLALRGVTNPSAPRKIYNTLAMLAYLLDVISPDHHWRRHLGRLIARHEIDTRLMGFPDDWEGEVFWSHTVQAQQEETSR